MAQSASYGPRAHGVPIYICRYRGKNKRHVDMEQSATPEEHQTFVDAIRCHKETIDDREIVTQPAIVDWFEQLVDWRQP